MRKPNPTGPVVHIKSLALNIYAATNIFRFRLSAPRGISYSAASKQLLRGRGSFWTNRQQQFRPLQTLALATEPRRKQFVQFVVVLTTAKCMNSF